MYKTSTNGLWKLYYIVISTIGHWLYILCENISKFFSRVIFERWNPNSNKRHSTLALLINLLTYIGMIYLLTLGYEKICTTFVTNSHSEDIDTLVGGYGNVFEYIKVKVTFIKVIFDLNTGNGGGFRFSSLIISTFTVLKMWWKLIIINTLYFSIIYGFLKEKLIEVNFLEKLTKRRRQNSNKSNTVGEGPTLNQLLAQLKEAIRDWGERKTIISNLAQNRKVLLAFIPILFVFSSIMYLTGIYKANLMSTGLEIIDSINLVNIILSFVITYIGTKVLQKGGAYVISISPDVIREWFEKLSESAGKQAQVFEEIRHRWADTHDLVWNETRARNRTGGEPASEQGKPKQSTRLKRINVFGNGSTKRK